jgi:hypothetical protein
MFHHFFEPTMKTMCSSFARSFWRSIGAVVVGVLAGLATVPAAAQTASSETRVFTARVEVFCSERYPSACSTDYQETHSQCLSKILFVHV